MPTYQYRCTECGTDLEAVQKFSDPALTECPTCQGQLRKVFNAVGVVFKGSGFYRTDSRAKDGANGASTSSGETKGTDGSGNGSPTKEGGSAGSNGAGAAPKTEGAKTPAKAAAGSSTGASSSS